MLNWHIFCICGAGPHVFAQGGKNLRIEYLEPSNAIHHSFQLLKSKMLHFLIFFYFEISGDTAYNSFDVFIFAVNSLDTENMVTKV